MPAEILFPVISDLMDPAIDQEGKRQRKLENKAVETDEIEKDPAPSTEDR